MRIGVVPFADASGKSQLAVACARGTKDEGLAGGEGAAPRAGSCVRHASIVNNEKSASRCLGFDGRMGATASSPVTRQHGTKPAVRDSASAPPRAQNDASRSPARDENACYRDAAVSVLVVESILGSLSFFERLRADEIARVAQRFACHDLAAGEIVQVEPTVGAQRLVVVIEGHVAVAVESRGRTLRSVLAPGDRHGDVALLAGLARRATLTANGPVRIATLDRAGLDSVLAEFPVIALALADEMAREVWFTNDLLRQLHEVWAERLSPDQRVAALEGRRDALQHRGARVTRLSTRALFRRLIVDPGGEPPFWAMLGFALSLSGARLVVALILKYGLEKRLFALVPGNDPNPMHVHHFNYGLVLIAVAGLAALFPFGRRALRSLAFGFGVGAGLVFDEFALFWHLNPEYSQAMSLYSAGIAFIALANLAFFRRFWVAAARRLLLRAGVGR